MSLQSYLDRYFPALDRELREVADRFLPGPPEFDLMLRYHLGWVDEVGKPVNVSQGKRIRPIILLLCAEVASGDWRQALPAAAAVELLHNFSLIHDDIEDNSPLRRGRPAVWKVWGVANAVNAGDVMFALAYAALRRLVEVGVTADCVLDVGRLFGQTCLVLTRGQYLDMAFECRIDVSVDEYLEMIADKSAALIAASAQLGAIVAGLSVGETEGYASFGRNLGLAFQVRDDVLGIWGDPIVTGKSVVTDIVSGKKSLPILHGLSCSSEFVDTYVRLHQEGDEGVGRVVDMLDSLGAREFALEYEARYFECALAALAVMGGESEAGRVLVDLVQGLLRRLA